MKITEVRIFPRESKDKKLKAYATITFDDSFVVRDIKVIQGNQDIFVAMPSRKLKISCPKCGHRNEARSKYCSQCGSLLPVLEQPQNREERQREHRDIAHPINSEFREYLQKTVLEEYEKQTSGQTESPKLSQQQEPEESKSKTSETDKGSSNEPETLTKPFEEEGGLEL